MWTFCRYARGWSQTHGRSSGWEATQLLSNDAQNVGCSQCIANPANPPGVRAATACGQYGSLWVGMALAAGYGCSTWWIAADAASELNGKLWGVGACASRSNNG